MKKNSLFVISIMALFIAAGVLYYYFYINTVSNYFLVKYTPPQPRESIFGEFEYTDSKLEYLQLENYSSDNMALETEATEAKHSYSWLLKEYEKELRQPNKDNPIIQNARMNAIRSMLEEERFLIRTTHIRKFSAEEALKMIQEHWADKSLEDYAKSNKIEVAVYCIPKI